MPSGRKVCHYVVSPPQLDALRSIETVEGYRALRTRAYSVARRAGISGGLMVFHAVRLGAERFNEGKDLGCREGPHFHILGDGWLTHTGEVHSRTGWVVKNLRVRSDLEGARATVAYLLTHAGVAVLEGDPVQEESWASLDGPEGILPSGNLRTPVEVVTWFGSMSYSALKVPPEPEGPTTCPVCGLEVAADDWYRLTWHGQGPPPTEPCVGSLADWRAHAGTDWTSGHPEDVYWSA